MTTLIFDGYIVKEGNDMENKLFFYSGRPVVNGSCNEFSVGDDGDNVFIFDLPIRTFMNTNVPQRCKITIELEK